MVVRIARIGGLSTLDYPRNLSPYKDWGTKETRLVLRDDKVFLKVTLLMKDWKVPLERDGVTVDTNIGEEVVGKDNMYVRVPNRSEDPRHYKGLAEGLQKKYKR
ncbi:hypothetical protein GWK48_09110 [Metallosphaera tengchongensis]|uniref:Transposase n=1 Tax=Metallosphaera tengchongensis TaxID=1532350 RepID=A0A6N0NZK5_9CREN|nr:hypothetical protein [Metallosphaera tengchongensis]QKR00510.1 hypothetical protein GWK48_09110 [Metallosphaera tengchongensis]